MICKSVETMNSLKLDFNKATDKDEMIIFLNGSLDDYNFKEFIRKINKLIKDGNVNLLLDCSKLTYISACGLGALIEILRNINGYRGRFVISSLQPQVAEVFNILGFSSFINIVKGMKESKIY